MGLLYTRLFGVLGAQNRLQCKVWDKFTIERTDIKLQDPSTRKLKVLTIGAGVSGILMAYQIQKYCDPSNVEHVIYEKNADVGGTWLENRYLCLLC
jgi:ribulose 1,5-bisphosphate synthetase/thiazole synthase